ncbi:MAG: hypothetical protein M1835_000018 [Candelina submexicana]|nr:MAG: hypothetical protein M1835_000018 [Candelina submexicana]
MYEPFLHMLYALLLAALVFFLTLAVYRIYFHQLARLPGPLLARISDLDAVLHTLMGTRHLRIHGLHQKYGDVVRFAPNWVAVNSVEGLNAIYGIGANTNKGAFYRVPARPTTVNTIDKRLHGRKRRVLSQALSDTVIKSLEPLMQTNINKFCSLLTSSPGAKNLADWCDWLAGDTISDLSFGASFGLLDGRNRYFPALVHGAAERILFAGVYPLFSKLHLETWIFRDTARNTSKYNAIVGELARQRMAIGTEGPRRDLFYFLLKAKDPHDSGDGLSLEELWGETGSIVGAASETINLANAATLHYLSQNPKIQEKLHRELSSHFNSVEDIVMGPVLNSCHYLRAVIDESLRMAPPNPGLMPREVQAGGLTVNGCYIPEGTVVGVCIYALHHSQQYFESPFAFDPERWMPIETPLPDVHIPSQVNAYHAQSAKAEERRSTQLMARAAFCPFLRGTRGCPAQAFAYASTRLTIAKVVLGWTFIPVTGERGETNPQIYLIKDHFSAGKDGPWLAFTARENNLGASDKETIGSAV